MGFYFELIFSVQVRPPCDVNYCGKDAICKEDPYGATECACPFGYSGNPEVECIRNYCVDHRDCLDIESCQNGHCVDPCQHPRQRCGENAQCEAINHATRCSCPTGFTGNPYMYCVPDEGKN